MINFEFRYTPGAGKSTTLKILTGDELPSAGQATLGGFDISEQPEQVLGG